MVLQPRPRSSSPGRGRLLRPSSPHARRRLRGAAGFFFLLLAIAFPALAGSLPVSITVDAGGGQAAHRTVQAAIDDAVARAQPATIHIRAGTYREVVDIPAGAPPIELVGDDAATTTIVFDNFASRPNPATGKEFGTFGSATVFVRSDDFRAQRLTFANDAGPVGQAVALLVTGTRAAFRDVRFLGHQDTLYLQGQDTLAWFGDCHIEGTVDFIFGAGTALFERCTIHSVGNGYVTAAATPQGRAFGYVFAGCELSAAAGVEHVYLGRPWRPYAKVAFVDSQLGPHVAVLGWHDWGKAANRATADYVEHGNRGPGADRSARVAWSRGLDATEAAHYTREAILGDWRPFE